MLARVVNAAPPEDDIMLALQSVIPLFHAEALRRGVG